MGLQEVGAGGEKLGGLCAGELCHLISQEREREGGDVKTSSADRVCSAPSDFPFTLIQSCWVADAGLAGAGLGKKVTCLYFLVD